MTVPMTTIVHHPDTATLMSFAAGSLPEALAAVVAVHVDMCARCRHEVASLDKVGGMLLETLPPVALTGPRPGLSVDSLRRPAPAAEGTGGARRGRNGHAPALEKLVGCELPQVAWRWLAPGLWHKPLPLSPAAGGDLRLIKVAPGVALPDHGHTGCELTLVLEGAYRDALGHYLAGDIADLDEDVEHQPVSDPHIGCICLIAAERKARFKGLLARLLQPLTGL